MSRLWLESGVDREEEASPWRIRGNVLNSPDCLVGEVRNLRVQTCVLRPGLQVPSAQLEAKVLRFTLQKPVRESRRDVVAEGYFAELHESAVLDIDRQTGPQTRETRIARCGICNQSTVIVVVREIDAVTTLSPVEQAGEGDRAKMEVVAESHLVIRKSIAD